MISEDVDRQKVQSLSEKETGGRIGSPVVSSIASNNVPNESPGMWDAFEHTIMFTSLYVAATTLGLLLHYYVNKLFSGIAGARRERFFESSAVVNGYYAALIVSFPIWLTLFLRIIHKTKLNPAIRNLKSRKKLIYLTLVITFIIVLYKLISTIYGLLEGDAGVKFFLHVLITMGISGTIFAYYLGQVKQDRKF